VAAEPTRWDQTKPTRVAKVPRGTYIVDTLIALIGKRL
jgi:hypothetical protein